jgi:metal-responsive CopG/Arc/MetJ family transcriptional regulator
MPMKKIVLSLSDEMLDKLQRAKKRSAASSVQELIRHIISDYFWKQERAN